MTKLNEHQKRTLIRLTNRIHTFYGCGDRGFRNGVAFHVEHHPSGSIMLVFNNSDGLPWYETFYMGCINIGVRGGIHHYNGEGVKWKYIIGN
jgi:hypothetical protein